MMRFKQIIFLTLTAAFVITIAGCSEDQKEKGRIMSTNELKLADVNFDKETSEGVVLVDFWAPWCGPCEMQGPIIEKVAEAMAGKAKVGKCNVDEAPKSAEKFGIRSIPTLVVLKDGKEVERFVGVQREADLIAVLKKYVGGDADRQPVKR